MFVMFVLNDPDTIEQVMTILSKSAVKGTEVIALLFLLVYTYLNSMNDLDEMLHKKRTKALKRRRKEMLERERLENIKKHPNNALHH